MHLPERTEIWLRSAVDQRLGTSHPAVVGRTLTAAILFFAAHRIDTHARWWGHLCWALAVGVCLLIVPAVKDLQRIFGRRFVNNLLDLAILAIPFTVGTLFTILALVPVKGGFRSEQSYWIMRALVGAIALAAWIVFGILVRVAIRLRRERRRRNA